MAKPAEQPQSERPGIEKLPVPEHSKIGKTVAVMSGKGGVGKSSVAALLAVSLVRDGYQVGVLDADITGPSIPKLFGVKEAPVFLGFGIIPPKTSTGIRVMSLNLLLPNEDDPVIWRGPLIANAVKQFWTDVVWGDLDFLVVDLPPGTGDAPLTVLQSLPLDGIVVVSSPQDLAVMVVKKAIKMARMLDVPLLGLIENMSGVRCPSCGELIKVFGESRAEQVCKSEGIRLLGVLPLDPSISDLGDRGEMEKCDVGFLKAIPSIMDESAGKGGSSE
jgi:Mrp family chromosome partitioning ATPase